MQKQKVSQIQNLAKGGVLTALYVAFTFLVAPLAYGPFQFRISEMFNHLVDFNKRYIWALTLGCLITNLQSPLGPIDMLVGTLGTLISALLIWYINLHVDDLKYKLMVSTVVPTFVGMLPIAIELHYIQHLPFWATYGTSMCGEFISCLVGAFLVYRLSKHIDLTK